MSEITDERLDYWLDNWPVHWGSMEPDEVKAILCELRERRRRDAEHTIGAETGMVDGIIQSHKDAWQYLAEADGTSAVRVVTEPTLDGTASAQYDASALAQDAELYGDVSIAELVQRIEAIEEDMRQVRDDLIVMDSQIMHLANIFSEPVRCVKALEQRLEVIERWRTALIDQENDGCSEYKEYKLPKWARRLLAPPDPMAIQTLPNEYEERKDT